MNVIYVDELFFLNALTDYLLLLSCAGCAGGRCGAHALPRPRRSAGCTPCSPRSPALVSRLARGEGARFAAHGVDRVRRAAGALARLGLLALSSAFAGAVYGISLLSGAEVRGMLSGASLKTLALSFGLCYAAVRLFSGGF